MNSWDSRQIIVPFFQELMTCGQELYSWVYDCDLTLLYDNSPDSSRYNILFFIHEYRDRLFALFQEAELPVIITNALGLMWIADFEKDENGELWQLHVLGPALIETLSTVKLGEELDRLRISPSIRSQVKDALDFLPILPMSRFCRFALMLHYTLTGERICVGDLRFISEDLKPGKNEETLHQRSGRGKWAREQAILRHITEGNTVAHRQRDQLSLGINVGKLSEGDAIRQFKNQIIIFTALCTRAAIRGGLSPDTAYEISDRYILNIERCTQIAEVIEIGKAMEEDFTRRVRKVKESGGISPQIQRCCDYIQMNLDKKLSVAELAEMAGYAKNYFMIKFKKDTGKSVSEYITVEKMERAKDLLKATDDSVQDIVDRLGYATQSHFGKRFHEYTGCTPKEYREK